MCFIGVRIWCFQRCRLLGLRVWGLGFRVWGVGLLHQGMPCFSGAGMCRPRRLCGFRSWTVKRRSQRLEPARASSKGQRTGIAGRPRSRYRFQLPAKWGRHACQEGLLLKMQSTVFARFAALGSREPQPASSVRQGPSRRQRRMDSRQADFWHVLANEALLESSGFLCVVYEPASRVHAI